MEARGFWWALSKQDEDTEMLQRLSPAVARLKLPDEEKRQPPRWTENMQHSTNTSTHLLSCCTPPTMRTLHLAQIYGIIQKQLVGVWAASGCTARFAFLFFLNADVSIEKKNIPWNAAVGKVGFNLHGDCFAGTTKAISMCVMCIKWTQACGNVVARFAKSACHYYMMWAARLRRNQTYLTSALGTQKKKVSFGSPKNNLTWIFLCSPLKKFPFL